MTRAITRQLPAALVLALAALGLPAIAQTKTEPNAAEKAWDSTKEGTEKAWDATKSGTKKGWDATKKGTSKAASATGKATDDAMTATRNTGNKINEKLPQTQNQPPLKP